MYKKSLSCCWNQQYILNIWGKVSTEPSLFFEKKFLASHQCSFKFLHRICYGFVTQSITSVLHTETACFQIVIPFLCLKSLQHGWWYKTRWVWDFDHSGLNIAFFTGFRGDLVTIPGLDVWSTSFFTLSRASFRYSRPWLGANFQFYSFDIFQTLVPGSAKLSSMNKNVFLQA